MLAQLETGRGNYGKVENTRWEGQFVVHFHVWSFKGGVPRLCRLRPMAVGPELIMYWHIQDLWGPANLVALTVVELDDTPPYLTGVQCDSVGATHGCSLRYRVEDLHLGEVGTTWLFDSHHELWLLAVSLWLSSVMLLGFTHAWLYTNQISVTPSEMGDGLLAMFKRRNFNFIMLWWELYGWWWLLCSHGLMIINIALIPLHP
jgi:hypothetical protein